MGQASFRANEWKWRIALKTFKLCHMYDKRHASVAKASYMYTKIYISKDYAEKLFHRKTNLWMYKLYVASLKAYFSLLLHHNHTASELLSLSHVYIWLYSLQTFCILNVVYFVSLPAYNNNV